MNNVLNFLKIDRSKILAILKREEEIRFSQEYISKCSEVSHIPNGWLEVTNNMQKELVKEFGYIDELSNTLAVNVIRKALNIYPDDEEIKNSVVHFRENIASKGKYKIGNTLKNISLHNLDSSKVDLFQLLDLNKPNIMLVGSHTWQPFRGYINLLQEFYSKNKERLNIFIVYISEAHAKDIWPLGDSAGTINYSHKKIEDRIDCANKFKYTFNLTIPIYCDNMNNELRDEYSCWPFRYFVIQNNKFTFIGQPEDSTFEFDYLMTL